MQLSQKSPSQRQCPGQRQAAQGRRSRGAPHATPSCDRPTATLWHGWLHDRAVALRSLSVVKHREKERVSISVPTQGSGVGGAGLRAAPSPVPAPRAESLLPPKGLPDETLESVPVTRWLGGHGQGGARLRHSSPALLRPLDRPRFAHIALLQHCEGKGDREGWTPPALRWGPRRCPASPSQWR